MLRLAFAVCAVVAVCAGNARADLKFDRVSVDLGECHSSLPASACFDFVNNGPEAVELVEVRPGCGCLTPYLDKRCFAAGEHGSIKLQARTLGQSAGPHTWTLTVVYKAGNQIREQELRLCANLVTEVELSPTDLAISTDREISDNILLTDLRPKVLTIRGVTTTAPWLHVEVEPPHSPNTATRSIHVNVTAACPPGRHHEQVVIYTDDPIYSELTVSLNIERIATDCKAAPSSLVWREGSQLVRISDREDRPVVVESAKADFHGLHCRWAPGPGNEVTLRLELDPATKADMPTYTWVRVQISSPVHQVLEIPVTNMPAGQ
jgi:hypothetical protein